MQLEFKQRLDKNLVKGNKLPTVVEERREASTSSENVESIKLSKLYVGQLYHFAVKKACW